MRVHRDSAVTAAGQTSLVQYADSQTTKDIYSIKIVMCYIVANHIAMSY